MCLTNVTTKRKTATEDIPCFKVLTEYSNGKFCTPYKIIPIVLGRSYTSKLSRPNHQAVEVGIHAFLTLEHAECMASYTPTRRKIVKCIIPKGAKYYIGEYYEGFKNTAIAATEIKYGHKLLK